MTDTLTPLTLTSHPLALGTGQLDQLIPALIAAKLEFAPVVKGNDNDAFKKNGRALKYADLEAVLEAVEPALLKNGLVLVQPTGMVGDEHVSYSYLIHLSGQYIESSYPLRPTKQDPQGFGGALTYARRYQALALLGIAPEDDDGNTASQKPAPARPAAPPRDWVKEADAATSSQVVKDIGRAAHAVGEFEGKVADHLRARVAELEAEEADKAKALAEQELAAEPVDAPKA